MKPRDTRKRGDFRDEPSNDPDVRESQGPQPHCAPPANERDQEVGGRRCQQCPRDPERLQEGGKAATQRRRRDLRYQ